MQLSDPALPIGGLCAFCRIGNLCAAGIVKDKATAKEFITEMLTQKFTIHRCCFCFIGIMMLQQQNDIEELLQLDEECTAVKLPREMRQASQKLGMRLIKNISTAL